MPYVLRTVSAGRVIERKKMYTARFGGKGLNHRSMNFGDTKETQAKVNERHAEERLRWKLNANFTESDLHVVLHYNDKPKELEQVIRDGEQFRRVLRNECSKQGIVLKYIACIETKRMTNPHHHVILPDMDIHIITSAWEKVTGGAGHASIKPLDSRGTHAELAAYLIKETRSTAKRLSEGQKNKKRFSCSKNLIMPEPTYRVIPAESWRKEPRVQPGWELYKFKDGSTVRTGYHEISGYAFQEYFEIRREEPKWRNVFSAAGTGRQTHSTSTTSSAARIGRKAKNTS